MVNDAWKPDTFRCTRSSSTVYTMAAFLRRGLARPGHIREEEEEAGKGEEGATSYYTYFRAAADLVKQPISKAITEPLRMRENMYVSMLLYYHLYYLLLLLLSTATIVSCSTVFGIIFYVFNKIQSDTKKGTKGHFFCLLLPI